MGLLAFVGYLLVMVVLVTIIAAVLLGIGTALTFLFAVSVWEATVVVIVVAAGLFFLSEVSGYADERPDEHPDEPLEDLLWRPRISVTDFSMRTRRRGKRRPR